MMNLKQKEKKYRNKIMKKIYNSVNIHNHSSVNALENASMFSVHKMDVLERDHNRPCNERIFLARHGMVLHRQVLSRLFLPT